MKWIHDSKPEKDGKYLVHCEAPQWDSEWTDIGIFKDGKWISFDSDFSHPSRVRAYSDIFNS